jgi:hypothetical protein
MNFMLLLVFLCAFNSLYSMEDPRDSREPVKESMVEVEVQDGFLSIPREKLLRCTVLVEVIHSSKTDTLPLKTDLYYTQENIKTLFECFDESMLIEKIGEDRIVDIFNIAGNMGAPREIKKKLAWHALNLGLNFPIDGGLIKSCNDVEIDFDNNATKLDLSNKKIKILLGLERFKSKNVTKIDISGNKLKQLDLGLFFKLFPNLQELNINDNKIDQLTLSRIPDMFILNARYNSLGTIKDIDSFLLGERCQLDLARNSFSEDIQKKIKWCARKRSLWNNIKVFYRYTISPVLIIRFFQVFFGTGIGLVSGFIIDGLKKPTNQFNFIGFGSLFGACLGYVYPTLSALLEYKNCKEESGCHAMTNGHLMCSLSNRSKSYVNFDQQYELFDGRFRELH